MSASSAWTISSTITMVSFSTTISSCCSTSWGSGTLSFFCVGIILLLSSSLDNLMISRRVVFSPGGQISEIISSSMPIISEISCAVIFLSIRLVSVSATRRSRYCSSSSLTFEEPPNCATSIVSALNPAASEAKSWKLILSSLGFFVAI